jgi:hypothetical protein
MLLRFASGATRIVYELTQYCGDSFTHRKCRGRRLVVSVRGYRLSGTCNMVSSSCRTVDIPWSGSATTHLHSFRFRIVSFRIVSFRIARDQRFVARGLVHEVWCTTSTTRLVRKQTHASRTTCHIRVRALVAVTGLPGKGASRRVGPPHRLDRAGHNQVVARSRQSRREMPSRLRCCRGRNLRAIGRELVVVDSTSRLPVRLGGNCEKSGPLLGSCEVPVNIESVVAS